MKKSILSFCVILITAITLQAQITIIPKAGASFSTIAFSDDLKDSDYDYVYKPGLVLGAAVEFPIGGDMFALQPELLFHQQGYKEKADVDGFTDETTYTLNYLELPVLAKFKFGKFYLNAGPSFGFGLGGKYEGEYSYQGQSQSYDGKIKFGDEPTNYEGDDYYLDNSLDIGVQLGGGVKIGPIIIDLRYGLGLTNLMDEPDGFSGDWLNQNRSFQLTIGYPILLGN